MASPRRVPRTRVARSAFTGVTTVGIWAEAERMPLRSGRTRRRRESADRRPVAGAGGPAPREIRGDGDRRPLHLDGGSLGIGGRERNRMCVGFVTDVGRMPIVGRGVLARRSSVAVRWRTESSVLLRPVCYRRRHGPPSAATLMNLSHQRFPDERANTDRDDHGHEATNQEVAKKGHGHTLDGSRHLAVTRKLYERLFI